MTRVTLRFICTLLVSGALIEASGLDTELYAKEISIEFFEHITVSASIDSEGGLGKLRLQVGGKDVDIAKEELAGLGEVDLHSLKIIASAIKSGNEGERLIAVSFEYGEGMERELPRSKEGEKVILRPCARFLFNGAGYVARYRAVPEGRKATWTMFVKLRGEPEEHDGVCSSIQCPFHSLANIRFPASYLEVEGLDD